MFVRHYYIWQCGKAAKIFNSAYTFKEFRERLISIGTIVVAIAVTVAVVS